MYTGRLQVTVGGADPGWASVEEKVLSVLAVAVRELSRCLQVSGPSVYKGSVDMKRTGVVVWSLQDLLNANGPVVLVSGLTVCRISGCENSGVCGLEPSGLTEC